jgi:spermidine synthase
VGDGDTDADACAMRVRDGDASAGATAACSAVAAVTLNWPHLLTDLQPCTGKRFALVRDYIAGTMLLIDLQKNLVVMSDSVPEQQFNAPIIEQAHGDVLCLGYGLGFIYGLLVAKPDVESVTVVELQSEVLTLVASQQDFGPKLRVVQADALSWVPDKFFDVIWDDCDYDAANDNRDRLDKWLKPGGIYLEWHDDGRYRR